MRDRVRLLIAFCALVLGVAHVGLGLAIYQAFTLDALWFAGAGLAMISVALSNFPAPRNALRDKLIHAAQNAIMVAFFAAAWVVLPAPQVALGAGLFSVLLLIRLAELNTRSPIG